MNREPLSVLPAVCLAELRDIPSKEDFAAHDGTVPAKYDRTVRVYRGKGKRKQKAAIPLLPRQEGDEQGHGALLASAAALRRPRRDSMLSPSMIAEKAIAA